MQRELPLKRKAGMRGAGRARMFWIFWSHYMSNDTIELAATRSPKKSRTSARYKENTHNTEATPSHYQGREIYCVLDDTLHCRFLSDNWHIISGFTAEEDLGEGFKDRIAPDHMRKVKHYLTEAGNNTTPVRFQLKHKDGGWRWCEMQCVEVKTENASPKIQHACLLRDITELVTTQGKLEKAKLEAELANKSRSEFLANMSHELRTPLNAILGFAQMIENGTFGEIGHPKYHDYIGSIQESGSTLLSKINDLLEIANIDSGRMVLNEELTDLTQVIRHAIEFHSHHAFSEQITLRERLPKQPLPVFIDRIRMLQVLTNLISNAIKYNGAGGVVDITCDTRKDGGINIIIEDNGGGIPSTHLQNILSAFRQDNSFFARSRDCVGLGLALSKEIVKLHHGRIEIESEQGKGTLITIRLPKERTLPIAAAEAPIEKPLEFCSGEASN